MLKVSIDREAGMEMLRGLRVIAAGERNLPQVMERQGQRFRNL